MNKRQNFSSGAKWEELVGYSRAVKIGNIIEVSGTVSIKDGTIYEENDPYTQTRRCLEIIEEYLIKAGSGINDVIRTRMYVTNIDDWKEIGRAHGEVFKHVKPATSMIEVSNLIDPACLIEIEATAIVQ